MAKKTCIHFDPVKPGCEIHNWRLKELDYVIKDLTPNNEHWVDPRYEGKSLADIRKEIAERYQAHVGQKMQAKAAPIREAAVVIKPDTTMADLWLTCNCWQSNLKKSLASSVFRFISIGMKVSTKPILTLRS